MMCLSSLLSHSDSPLAARHRSNLIELAYVAKPHRSHLRICVAAASRDAQHHLALFSHQPNSASPALDRVLSSNHHTPYRRRLRSLVAIRKYFSRLEKSDDKVKMDVRKVAVLDDNVAYVAGFDEFAAIRNGQTGTSSNGFNGFGRSEAIMADYSSALVAALMNTRWQ
jgi:hypothetical protein